MKGKIATGLAALLIGCSAPQVQTETTPANQSETTATVQAETPNDRVQRIRSENTNYTFRQEARTVSVNYGDVNADGRGDVVVTVSALYGGGSPELEMHDFDADGIVDRAIHRPRVMSEPVEFTYESDTTDMFNAGYLRTLSNAVSCIEGECGQRNPNLETALELVTPQPFRRQIEFLKDMMSTDFEDEHISETQLHYSIGAYEVRIGLSREHKAKVEIIGPEHSYTVIDEGFDGNNANIGGSCPSLKGDQVPYRFAVAALSEALSTGQNEVAPGFVEAFDRYMQRKCGE